MRDKQLQPWDYTKKYTDVAKNPEPQRKLEYKEAYTPHQMSTNDFYSNVSRRLMKPDPSTVEAELQLEEELWNS